MLLSRLQGETDIAIHQATDELYVHHLLSSSYQARYEEGTGSPDFRLYRSSKYAAGLEVLTLFAEKDFASQVSRNTTLVEEINRRVQPERWLVKIDIIDWKRQPRVKDIASWLVRKIADLPPPAADLPRERYPNAVYSSAAVELGFEFIPWRTGTPATEYQPIVAIGPAVAWYSQAVGRLRNALSHKVGSRNDLRDRPYAVLVSARDVSCDIEDIFNALYGDTAIEFSVSDLDSARPIRKNNGTFGRSGANPEGRVRRLSCVFALMRDWMPGAAEAPTLIRFDNPFAMLAFPEDVLPQTSQFAAHQSESGVSMEWEPSLPSW